MMLQKYLLVFLVSMVPMIELRGAVLLAPGLACLCSPLTSSAFWGICYPCLSFICLPGRILTGGADKPVVGPLFSVVPGKRAPGRRETQSKSRQGAVFGSDAVRSHPHSRHRRLDRTLAASFLDMEFKPTVLAVLTGVAIAGIIMTLVGTGVFAVFSFHSRLSRFTYESRETTVSWDFSRFFCPYFHSPDKVGGRHRLPLRRRKGGSLPAAEDPGQVAGQGAHGLQTLQILGHLLRSVAVDLVPILTGCHNQIVHAKK